MKLADDALLLNLEERLNCSNIFRFSEVKTPNIDTEHSELEDKTLDTTPGNDSQENISFDGEEPPVKKVKVDNGEDVLDNDNTNVLDAKPEKSTPKSSSQKPVNRTPKQTKTTPNKTNRKANKEVAKRVNKGHSNKPVKSKQDSPSNKVDEQVTKIKDKYLVVNHSPTLCTVKMDINPKTPENGKRKRGRPRKDLVFHVANKDQPTVTVVKKLRTEKSLSSESSPSAESERSDGASDTNSISSVDLESRKSSSKIREYVCKVCEKPDDLLICEGVCNNAYHKDCLTSDNIPEKFMCDECTTGNHTCFVCSNTDNVVKCSFQNCGKFYHLDCIKSVDPKVKDENFICPLHQCNVCGTSKNANSKRRLACCTRCPVAYHSSTCIVAGSLPITSQHLVCNRHFIADPKKAHHLHVNVNWCFVCSIGGTLICCESCPAAFHPECIEETGIPEGRFFCRDCKDGKELLYGEIVWVKLGMYRYCNVFIPCKLQNTFLLSMFYIY